MQGRKLIFWVCGIVLFCLFLYLIREILLPFVVGIIVAYFLDPAADKLERAGFSRTMATITIVSSFFVVLVIGGVIIFPALYDEFAQLMNLLPNYIYRVKSEYFPYMLRQLNRIDSDMAANLKDEVGKVSAGITGFFGGLVGRIWDSGLAFINLMSLLFITPIVSFYLLRDWDRITYRIDDLLPRDIAPVIREQLHEIDRSMAGFIRGQTNVCLLTGLFYAFGLSVVGLDFGLIIGLATGILTFIPYVGMLFGSAIGIGAAIFQFSDFSRVLMVIGVFIIGQILESNFLTPRLVGNKVGLHPVWIMFGILAGGALFGFVGVLAGVPITAAVAVLVRFAIKQYKNSHYYLKNSRSSHIFRYTARQPGGATN